MSEDNNITIRPDMLSDDNNSLQTEAVPGAGPGTEAVNAEQTVAVNRIENGISGVVMPPDWYIADQAERVKFFGTMAVPCLIFSLVFGICLFRNTGGIAMPVWVGTVIALVLYATCKLGRKLEKESIFVTIIMMLISVSSFLTGSEILQVLNIVALMMLTVYLVLLNFADTRKWDLGKHFVQMLAAVFGSLGYLMRPFTEASAYAKNKSSGEKGKKGNGRQILIGLLIAIPCLVILGALLGQADMVFESMLDSVFENVFLPDNFMGTLWLVVFGFFASYCGLHYAWSRGGRIEVSQHRNAEPVTAITVNAAIAALYLIFSVIQILYLFIGNFELPGDVTYAEYAREGFFQLLAVCIINMLLVLAMKKYVRRNRALDIVLIVICACTYIMIASSACRMIMYIRAYELTMLRVFVLFALFTLAFLMAGVIISIVNEDFPFFRYGLAVVCIVYLVLVFSKPDSYIAKYNFDSAYSVEKENSGVDFYYIARLSTDAAPVIDEYIRENSIDISVAPYQQFVLEYKHNNKAEIQSSSEMRRFNVSAYRASRLGWTK